MAHSPAVCTSATESANSALKVVSKPCTHGRIASLPTLASAFGGIWTPSSVTEGIVSAVNRDLGDGSGPVWLQHHSVINQGNSGGPLLDMEGKVVGVNTLSMDQLSSGASVQGMFFAIPANLARTTAAKLIAQLQSTTTQERATKLRGSRFKTAYYTLTLPIGWISSHVSRKQTVLVSRDQLVQVQFRTSATPRRPNTARLRQVISRLVRASGRVKRLTFSAITVGRLRGISGIKSRLDTATAPDQLFT